MKKKLTAKQKSFCEEYLIDKNATQSAIRAGYSKKTSGRIGQENLQKPVIKEYIAKLIDKQSIRTQITADRVLEEIARIAFSRLSDVAEWDKDGIRLKDNTELSDDILGAIKEVSETITINGSSMKIKMYNKENALEKLAKHLGLFKDQLELSGSITINNDVPRK